MTFHILGELAYIENIHFFRLKNNFKFYHYFWKS